MFSKLPIWFASPDSPDPWNVVQKPPVCPFVLWRSTKEPAGRARGTDQPTDVEERINCHSFERISRFQKNIQSKRRKQLKALQGKQKASFSLADSEPPHHSISYNTKALSGPRGLENDQSIESKLVFPVTYSFHLVFFLMTRSHCSRNSGHERWKKTKGPIRSLIHQIDRRLVPRAYFLLFHPVYFFKAPAMESLSISLRKSSTAC